MHPTLRLAGLALATLGVAAVACATAVAGGKARAKPLFKSFPAATHGSSVGAIARGSDGRMWYPESGHSHAAWSTASRVDRLGEIDVPTLIMHGTLDPVVPVAHAHLMAQEIPDNESWIIEGLGHETPAALSAALARRLLAHVPRVT